MQIITKSQETIIDCEQYIELNSIFDFKTIFENAVNAGQPVTLKASELIKIDAAALQLFLSFINSLKKNKIPYKWDSVSSVLLSHSNLLGMTDELALETRSA